MNTKYEQIVDIENIASFNSKENVTEIIALSKNERMKPASQDQKRILLLAIDVQNDFMENIGSLPVSGSKGDVERLTRWIHKNTEGLTQIICSLDCHSITQIFFSDWWVDKDGNHPQPFTVITSQDIIDSRWLAANGETERSLEYLKALELDDKKQLCIWPYHCLEGTRGAKLERVYKDVVFSFSRSQ